MHFSRHYNITKIYWISGKVFYMAKYTKEQLHQLEHEERDCYCGLWKDKPEILEKQSIPFGYCGYCKKCDEPVHTRHFPGILPYSSTWCDEHYKKLKLLHPLAFPAILFWVGFCLVAYFTFL